VVPQTGSFPRGGELLKKIKLDKRCNAPPSGGPRQRFVQAFFGLRTVYEQRADQARQNDSVSCRAARQSTIAGRVAARGARDRNRWT